MQNTDEVEIENAHCTMINGTKVTDNRFPRESVSKGTASNLTWLTAFTFILSKALVGGLAIAVCFHSQFKTLILTRTQLVCVHIFETVSKTKMVK